VLEKKAVDHHLTNKAEWTLAMVVAWILTRDYEVVWRFSPDNQTIEDRHRILNYMEIAISLFATKAGKTAGTRGAFEAVEDVTRALREGALSVRGLSHESSKRETVPADGIDAHEISYSKRDGEPHGCLRYATGQHAREVTHRALLFPSAEVTAKWPAEKSVSDTQPDNQAVLDDVAKVGSEIEAEVTVPPRVIPPRKSDKEIADALRAIDKEAANLGYLKLTKTEAKAILMKEFSFTREAASTLIEDNLLDLFTSTRGPRGSRNPNRNDEIQELIRKLIQEVHSD